MRMMESERLRFREFTVEDFDWLYEILSDPVTMAYYPKPYDENRTRRWISWNLDNYEKYGFGLWALEFKESGEMIGDCGITMQNIDGELLPEIGYHIDRRYWRKSLGKEAAETVRDWGFMNREFDALYSYMPDSNVASYSTAASIGMKRIKEYDDPDGVKHYVYRITREEWEKNEE